MVVRTGNGPYTGPTFIGSYIDTSNEGSSPGVAGTATTPGAFNQLITDASSFSLTLDSGTRNAIQWIAAKKHILIGTTGGEWRMGGHSNKPFTPTNYDLKQQTNRGSKDLQAVLISDAMAFINETGRKLYKLRFDGISEDYETPDLTILAEHISKSGVTSMAFQRNPDEILWATLLDGTLVSMTYDPIQNVIAWARHPLPSGGEADDASVNSGYLTAPEYPLLQELTASEIPDKPTEIADTALSGASNITNKTELQNISGSGHYILTADIDATGSWTPINGFTGVLDGDGFKISNLTISAAASDNQGMFGTIGAGAEIRNIKFHDASITADDAVAVLIGFANGVDDGKLSDIEFINCTVNGDNGVGCLIGNFFNVQGWQIWRCKATGTTSVVGTGMNIGGLIGDLKHDGTTTANVIVDCSNEALGRVQGDGSGGIIGDVDGGGAGFKTEIHTCSSSCEIARKVSGDIGAGGLIGKAADCNITSCNATGEITGLSAANDSAAVGGFLGFDKAGCVIINCFSTGDVTVHGDAARIGGFCGKSDTISSTFRRCYSTGNVSCLEGATSLFSYFAIGGFMGSMEANTTPGLIERCWSEGNVTIAQGAIGAGNYGCAGGFVGNISVTPPTIRNCYAWGSLTATDGEVEIGFGGFLGGLKDVSGLNIDADVSILNCYCAQTNVAAGSSLTGQITSDDESGGFTGSESNSGNFVVNDVSGGNITCFWDSTTSSLSRSDSGTSQITSWLQTKANFTDVGWDFDTIWQIPTPVFWKTELNANGIGGNSVAVIPGDGEDEVWVMVGRSLEGSLVRYIERMKPRDWGIDNEDMFFIDSGLTYDSTPTATITGLSHLEGETVAILGDGAELPTAVVSGGSITLAESVSVAQVGLPFTYKLKINRFDQNTQQGTSKGSIKKIAEVVISFYRTLNAKFGDGTTTFKVSWRESSDNYGDPPALFSGDKVVHADGGFNVEDPFQIEGNSPMPCSVRAIIPRFETVGR
ncbi:MAG TPA: hypothetical protein ENH94_08190 [Phycisphaerales bacterium]|nr:hypothetical protein [Phycisphaerales bacterium]